MAVSNEEYNFDDIVVTEDDKEHNAKSEKLAAGLPDPGKARLEKYKRRPRVALNFSVPDTLKQAFDEKAVELGYTRDFRGHIVGDLTAMLYHCMREVGIDVPDEKYIDGRVNRYD